MKRKPEKDPKKLETLL